MRKNGIKNIKNHTASTISWVHNLTFGLFDAFVCILLDRIILERLLPNNIWAEIIRGCAFAGGYYAIYFIIKFILEKATKNSIPFEGKWYHVHIPNNSLVVNQERIATLSAGVTNVSRKLNDFTFVSRNYRYTVDNNENLFVRIRDTLCKEKADEEFYRTDQNGNEIRVFAEPDTKWHTETSEISDENGLDLVEIYKATSEQQQVLTIYECPTCRRRYNTPRVIDEAPRSRYGIHLYTVKENGDWLHCKYSDCWPSLKTGDLYLFRNRNDRDAKIQEFFREHTIND